MASASRTTDKAKNGQMPLVASFSDQGMPSDKTVVATHSQGGDRFGIFSSRMGLWVMLLMSIPRRVKRVALGSLDTHPHASGTA